MFGVRDIAWSIALCALLTIFGPCRASMSAKAVVERDAEQGFLQAYEGSRFVSGEIVTTGGGSYADPTKPMIEARRFEIIADRQNLTGSKIELVARHVIKLVSAAPGSEDATQEAHLKLEREGGKWVYTLFETRDGQLVEPSREGNPWAQALLARTAAAERAAQPAAVEAGE